MGALSTHYKKMQDGGPTPPAKSKYKLDLSAVNYLDDYYKSPKFKDRYTKNSAFTSGDYDKQVGNSTKAKNNFNPFLLEKEDPNEMLGSRVVNSTLTKMYNNSYGTAIPSNANMVLSVPQAKKLKSDINTSILPHEYSHTARQMTLRDEIETTDRNKNPAAIKEYTNYIKQKSKPKGEKVFELYLKNKFGDHHAMAPSENHADLDAVRYQLFNKGIYDTRKGDMTQKDLDKAAKDPTISKDLPFNRLRKNFKDKDIIWMNNNIAANKPKEELPIGEFGGNIETMKKQTKKMATGGFTNWANKNQEGISAVGDYGSAVVDAFAPTDAYGVRSNGASIGSGALSGAAKGAAIGSSVPIIGTAAGAIGGAIVGGITGLLGNDKAKKEKDIAIEKKTTAQLAATQAGADARIAGDPGLKYGRMAASYYRFGGVMKGTPATLPRKTQPMATVQAKPRLMPNITESPMRQMSRKANGGSIDPLSSSDIKVEGASHENGGVKFPSLGVELEGGETVNNGFVFSKKLGFAKPAEAIAKQLGKAEKRPETAINTSTINALKRKTELLKAHQEVAKEAAGIPSDLPEMADGGPIIPRDSTYRGALVQNGGRTINQQVLQQQGGSTGVQVVPMPIDYNRNFREFQMGVPGRNLPVNPTPAIIRSPTGRTYKNGGIIKKMAAGGFTQPAEGTPVYPWDTNPITGLIDRLKVPTTELPEVNITTPRLLKAKNPGFNYSTPKDPFTDLKPIKSAAVASKATESEGTGFNDVASKIAPFVSNFVNATQKLPLPPVPQLNTEITPNLVDYSSSRNEAVRANRSANASARTNLNSGAAVSASVAANLAGQTRAVSQINEAENNANAQIRNSTAAENAQIKAGNTALQNNYQNELVARQIKGQSLASANIANLEEKVQGMAKDKKLFNLEGEKAILGFLSNNDSGAGYDAARPILEKHLTPDQMKQMDVWATKARADRKSEGLKTLSTYKLQADYAAKKGMPTTVLNGVSTVAPGKMKRAGTETETEKKGTKTTKKTTAIY